MSRRRRKRRAPLFRTRFENSVVKIWIGHKGHELREILGARFRHGKFLPNEIDASVRDIWQEWCSEVLHRLLHKADAQPCDRARNARAQNRCRDRIAPRRTFSTNSWSSRKFSPFTSGIFSRRSFNHWTASLGEQTFKNFAVIILLVGCIAVLSKFQSHDHLGKGQTGSQVAAPISCHAHDVARSVQHVVD